MEFDLSESSLQWRDRLQAFFDKEVLPRHRDWALEVAASGMASFMPELQRKARAAGLWNLALPELAADEPGTLDAFRPQIIKRLHPQLPRVEVEHQLVPLLDIRPDDKLEKF